MDSTRLTFLLTGCLLVAGLLFPCRAEITVDGSLGNEPGAITAGPNQEFTITEDLGKKVGSNLFHSFGVFDIRSGETATFSGTSPIENILSRVTGGSASNIDGTLRTDFANATPNLFLINPAGVLFGPNASLDVQGSFHVSTADFVRLEGGVRFTSVPSVEDPVLTTAPPEAFGFLGENPANVSFEGSNGIVVQEGETLSVIGGDVEFKSSVLSDDTLVNTQLRAPSGRINIASVASNVIVDITDSDLLVQSLSETEAVNLGSIDVTEATLISGTGATGGSIFVKGGRLIVEKSTIRADTLEAATGGSVDVNVNELNITDGAFISTEIFGSGMGGNVTVEADSVFLSGEKAESFTGIAAQAALGSTGDAGKLTLKAGIVEMDEGAEISTATFGSGKAGNLRIQTDSIKMRNGSKVAEVS